MEVKVKDIRKAIGDVTLYAIFGGKRVKQAVKYLAPNFTVKATRSRRRDNRDRSDTLVVTVGRPNYSARAFIKAAKKAKEQFPIKRVQFKFFPEKRV